MNKQLGSKHPNQHWPVVNRILLAILGGYAITYGFTAALARVLPMARVDALIAATLPSFVVYLIFIIWAFTAKSLRRVALVTSLSVPLAALGFWPHVLEAVQ